MNLKILDFLTVWKTRFNITVFLINEALCAEAWLKNYVINARLTSVLRPVMFLALRGTIPRDRRIVVNNYSINKKGIPIIAEIQYPRNLNLPQFFMK